MPNNFNTDPILITLIDFFFNKKRSPLQIFLSEKGTEKTLRGVNKNDGGKSHLHLFHLEINSGNFLPLL